MIDRQRIDFCQETVRAVLHLLLASACSKRSCYVVDSVQFRASEQLVDMGYPFDIYCMYQQSDTWRHTVFFPKVLKRRPPPPFFFNTTKFRDLVVLNSKLRNRKYT